MWTAPVGALGGALVRDARGWYSRMSREDWALVAFLVVGPYVCAFGTNNNYWYSGANAGLLMIAAGLVIAYRAWSSTGTAPLAGFAAVSLLVSALLVSHGLTYPYGQADPLSAQASPTSVRGSRLFVQSDFQRYLDDARRAAAGLGFREGAGIIDLTGRSPGLIFAIGGHNFPDPWMIGGYRGSVATASAAIARVSCADLARSWLLLEPDAGRSLPTAILSPSGLQVPGDYRVAAFPAPAMDGQGPSRQFLLRPTDVGSIERKCETARRQRSG